LEAIAVTTQKNLADLVFHYRCRHCGVLIDHDGQNWVDQGRGTSCKRTHLPNGQFSNGTRNSSCRHCGADIVWTDNTWVSESVPPVRTCAFTHTV
jgi:hypothetical protein